MQILTVGHSTLPFDAFLALIGAHGVEQIADVRTLPRSGRQPHFTREPLAVALAAHQIRYRHFPALGGLRRPLPDSPNTAWRNESFRGYADHMMSAEFARGVTELLQFAEYGLTAIMCAEAVFWRCHRALLSDALILRQIDVVHIVSNRVTKSHVLSSFARVDGGKLLYPGLL